MGKRILVLYMANALRSHLLSVLIKQMLFIPFNKCFYCLSLHTLPLITVKSLCFLSALFHFLSHYANHSVERTRQSSSTKVTTQVSLHSQAAGIYSLLHFLFFLTIKIINFPGYMLHRSASSSAFKPPNLSLHLSGWECTTSK